MEKSDTKPRPNVIWDFLSSVKLTLFLLVILAATSIFGTLIPQQQEAMKFTQKLSPGLVKLFSALELFDMYHSIWFRLIIGALALNLIVCTLDRLPTTLRLFRAHARPDRAKPFTHIPPERDFLVKGLMAEVADQVAGLLSGSYKNIKRKQTDQGHFLYCEKGRISYFGVYLVHLSVLLILIGGIIGSIWGFEAYVNIPEGKTIETVFLNKSRAEKKLGFAVQCEKFTVDFYPNGAPKVYQSDLRFLNDGKVMVEGKLRVNGPMAFRGITFYQSSYGKMPGGKIHLRIVKNESEQKEWALEVEKVRPENLPGNEGRFQVLKVEEDMNGSMGPAALISILPGQGEEIRFWVFKNWDIMKNRFPPAMLKSPILNPSAFKPYTFHLENIETVFYTGLQVNRDPGVNLVWAGFFLIVIGLFAAFFMSHKKIWVRVSPKAEKINISVAGRANKNRVGMERELDQLSQKLQNLLTL